MYINTAIIEKLEYNGTLKSVELKSSYKIGDLIVAFADEYNEPHKGPFHFKTVKHETVYNKKMEKAKARRLGAGYFVKEGNEYIFRTQWEGIPTERQKLSYYALMLPTNAVPTQIRIYDPLSDDFQYNRSIRRDDFNKCYIIYLECKSRKGVFNFNLECSFIIDEKQFPLYMYGDDTTQNNINYIDIPEKYNRVINLECLPLDHTKSIKAKKVFNNKVRCLGEEQLMCHNFDYISRDEVEKLKSYLDIVIMTATDIEKETVFKYLKPLPGCSALKVDTTNKQTYTIGILGAYPIVHVQTNMGSSSPDGSTLTTKDALDYWKPKALIMPGVAFGKDSTKQKIGDILIAESIIQYDSSKIKEGIEIPRGSIVRSGLILFDRFRNCSDWDYKLEDGTKVGRITGKVLSGSKLVDDKEFKKHLFQLFPEAIGGEMEGCGLYAASFHESFNQWILVKGICDWAENKESEDKEKNQQIASEAAVSLCFNVMNNPYAFECLGIKSIIDIDKEEILNDENEVTNKSKNTTIFNGPIYGSINTGSGNIYNK